MAVTISAIALFGLITIILIRTQRLTTLIALPVFLFGFTAASTGLAGPVNDAMTAIAQMVTNLT